MDDEHHHVARLPVLHLREVIRFLLVDSRLSLLFIDVGSLDVLGIGLEGVVVLQPLARVPVLPTLNMLTPREPLGGHTTVSNGDWSCSGCRGGDPSTLFGLS